MNCYRCDKPGFDSIKELNEHIVNDHHYLPDKYLLEEYLSRIAK